MNYLRKFVLGLIVLCMILSMLPPAAFAATEIASGTCGDNLTWTLDSDGLLTIGGSGAMKEYSSFLNVPWLDYEDTIRKVTIHTGVTTISEYAFYSCTNLTSITIPDSVTGIGKYAFYFCTSLNNITIPGSVTSIHNNAFDHCTSLNSITIPNSVTSIGEYAFYSCTSLHNIIISEGVASIGQYAFNDCTSLTSITIPDSVRIIGTNAFVGCDNLTGIWVDPSNPYFSNDSCGVLFNKTKTDLIEAPGGLSGMYAIPNSVSSVGSCAFWGCSRMSSIIIPNSVTSIADYAFIFCTNLTDISIPDSVISIGNNAFSQCSSLTNIEFDDNSQLTSIGESAFSRCENLEEIIIPYGVTEISDSTFSWCSDLTSITIPNSVISIGSGAFWNCDSLYSVHFCGTEVTWNNIEIAKNNDDLLKATIYFEPPEQLPGQLGDGWGRWSDYIDAQTIVIYPVDGGNLYFGQEIFWSDPQKNTEIHLLSADSTVTNASIPSVVNGLSVTGISTAAFSNCAYLISVHIPASVQVIGDWPFTRCSSLTDITVENGNTTYFSADGALYATDGEHTSLLVYPVGKLNSSFQIYDGTTRIEYYAFSGSANLVSVTIPKSITYIGGFAFEDCSNLSDIYYTGTAEQWSKINIRCDDPAFLNATIHYDSTGSSNAAEGKLVVYSDYTNLSISTGSTLTLSAGIQLNEELLDDPSSITFQIADTSILEVIDTGISGNCRYVKLKGLRNGTTTVAFTDAATGKTITIPVTVYDNYHHCYTLSNVPKQHIEKYPTNFYNVNGLYVDSYQYTVNKDGSATVSFDVYNTNYIYCTVEVFDQDGNLACVVLIDKMTSSNTSIKEAIWDNIGYLIRDCMDEDIGTYRQESGFSKHTSVTIEIPKNGYLRICTDPEESLIVGLVNAADIIMQFNKISGNITDYGVDSKDFAENLTMKLLADKFYAQYLVDGSKFPQELMKNIGKETLMTATSMGDFADTIAHNLGELNLAMIITDTALDCGFGIAEETFTDATGWIGTVLEVLFVVGKAENVIIQHSDYSHAQGTGSIYIQNQGGGLRASQQITVECENELDSDTALNVFTVTIDPALVEAIKETNPDLYEAFVNGVTHTYNISLLQNGEEVQPEGKVTVYIPIPEDMRILAYAGQVKIYRTEENGTVTEMNVSIQNNCFVFETDHFSLYTLVAYAPEQDPLPPVDEESDSTVENDNTTEEKVPPITDNKNKNSTNMWIVVLVIAAVVVFTVLMIPVFKKKKA